mmetsp:Transcript_8527/g.26623  ORF Transcript_8527/g.26623 Transcript_8527/m.26623 type:complete len:308 (-) Transcript_8527:2639-3562(-)
MKCSRIFSMHEEKCEACAIYAVDVHPDGSLLATCGADKNVRIWFTEQLKRTERHTDPVHELSSSQSKCSTPETISLPRLPAAAMQAVLSKHTQVVTCVRWSLNGQYLASGSDDTTILLWKQVPAGLAHTSDSASGWHRISTLCGHEMDVLDLAWSGHGLLASCSIDNKILIWQPTLESITLLPQRELTGHINWVKGVAWDPLGRFLASASEDKRVIIWRAHAEWPIEAEITVPFVDATTQTFFQRLSWSPDGLTLGVPNAIKSRQQVAAIIARNRWQTVEADLVGHKHPVTVVRFCPLMQEPSVDYI